MQLKKVFLRNVSFDRLTHASKPEVDFPKFVEQNRSKMGFNSRTFLTVFHPKNSVLVRKRLFENFQISKTVELFSSKNSKSPPICETLEHFEITFSDKMLTDNDDVMGANFVF